MTATTFGNVRNSNSSTGHTGWHFGALLLVGFAIGFLVFGTQGVWDQISATSSHDASSVQSEDWHGNVRRSSPTR
ncbi:MAG: hypothetical protein ABJI96_17845 [Paracoccaceae bacterium]